MTEKNDKKKIHNPLTGVDYPVREKVISGEHVKSLWIDQLTLSEEQELRGKLTEAVNEWLYGAKITDSLVNLILALIKQAGYVKLAEDQNLPQYRCANYMLLGDEFRKTWDNKIKEIKECQQELLQGDGKRVWRAVLLESGEKKVEI